LQTQVVSGTSAFAKDLIHDTLDRRLGVDCYIAFRDILFRGMQPHNQLSFVRFAAEFIFRSLGKSSLQRVDVDVEYKNPIEQFNELVEIPRASAEKRLCEAPIRN
jgi:hypothetical protein